jgi:hypothetical protein
LTSPLATDFHVGRGSKSAGAAAAARGDVGEETSRRRRVDDSELVSNMMDEQERRREVIERARATVERVDDMLIESFFTRPVPDRLDVDRRELARFHRDLREREAASAPAAARSPDWESWLRARLVEERRFVLECVGTALGEALRKERNIARRELADEVKRLHRIARGERSDHQTAPRCRVEQSRQ